MSARGGFLLAGALLLVGCAAPTPREPPRVEAGVLWQQRAAQLQALDAWSFNGRAAVSGPGIASRTVRVSWSMAGDAYELAFMSVLGQRVAELSGGADGATLRLPREEPRSAGTPEELLDEALGWTAPVRGLRHWVLGLPAPSPLFGREPAELDPWGRLLGLDQDGWRVEFDRYTEAGGLELPQRLTLSHPRLRIRLLIDEWKLEHDGRRG